MSGPNITIGRKSGSAGFAKRMQSIQKLAAYVGVPADDKGRTNALIELAGKTSSKKKTKRIKSILLGTSRNVSNAELLFINSKGSPIKGIPARPVIEPAIAADGNRQSIAHELAEVAKATLQDKPDVAQKRLRRAALAGQNAARRWFTDSRNNWAPNKPATIRRKGSDKPLIDTGVLRAAIVGITREE